jgi:hypothetical protein
MNAQFIYKVDKEKWGGLVITMPDGKIVKASRWQATEKRGQVDEVIKLVKAYIDKKFPTTGGQQ